MESSYSQKAEFNNYSDSLIVWNKNIKLSGVDFKQKNNQMIDNPEVAAYSCTFLSSSYSLENDTLIIKIVAKFNKNSSWINLIGQSIVNHEQGHFNLQEIEARTIRKKILEVGKLKFPTEKELDSLIEKYYIYYDAMQNKYDTETEHSFNAINQNKWDIFIRDELKKLQVYGTEELKFYRINPK